MAPYNFNRNGSVVAVPLPNHQEKDVSTTNQRSAVERRFLGTVFIWLTTMSTKTKLAGEVKGNLLHQP